MEENRYRVAQVLGPNLRWCRLLVLFVTVVWQIACSRKLNELEKCKLGPFTY